MHNPCITLYIPRRKYPYNMPYTSEMSQRTSVLLYALHLANCTRAIPISSAATSFPTLSTSLIFLALLGRRPSPTLLILSSATLRSLATPLCLSLRLRRLLLSRRVHPALDLFHSGPASDLADCPQLPDLLDFA